MLDGDLKDFFCKIDTVQQLDAAAGHTVHFSSYEAIQIATKALSLPNTGTKSKLIV